MLRGSGYPLLRLAHDEATRCVSIPEANVLLRLCSILCSLVDEAMRIDRVLCVRFWISLVKQHWPHLAPEEMCTALFLRDIKCAFDGTLEHRYIKYVQ